MDVQEIIALSDLISSSVQKILSLADGDTLYSLTDSAVRKHTLQITAAASQLISVVRPPEQYIIETSIAVSLLTHDITFYQPNIFIRIRT